LFFGGGRDGFTALHLATEAGMVDTIEVLIAGGSDPNRRNGQGEKPLDMTTDPEAGYTALAPHRQC